jgi:hypothetical protein
MIHECPLETMLAWMRSPSSSPTEWITVVISALGGAFLLFQYWRSNRESRARAAADEIEKLSVDDSVRTALRIIDWHSGYIPYIDETGVRHRQWFGALDYHLALRPHTKRRSEVFGYVLADDPFAKKGKAKGKECDELFTPVEQYVRDVFDSFLGRLERIDSLIDSGVISRKNFEDSFSYWLHVIGDVKAKNDPLAHFSNAKRDTLITYIEHYKFNGVRRLFKRCGKRLHSASLSVS